MSDRSNGVPPHFIVFVPGIMGSKLRETITREIVWIDFSMLPKLPWQWDNWIENLLTTLAYPNDNLVPAGIVDDVLFLPPWIKQEQYGRMFTALERMGYRADPLKYGEQERDVYAFAYDWRQDNRISARQLKQEIERWRGYHPGAEVWILAHSMGGLVSRWYIEKEGGKEHVTRLFLLASPWDGAPKALNMLTSGFEVLFRQRFGFFAGIQEMTRDLIRTFPSVYQLLPYENPFLRGTDNEPIDIFESTSWLDSEEQRRLLREGRAFNLELGRETSVDTLCFFGVKRPTVSDGVVNVIAQGRWDSITWRSAEAGDGTVPERSAVHTGASEKLPFAVGHGDIYVDPALLEKLDWELIRRYRAGVLAEVTTERLRVIFEPESFAGQDAFDPGETFGVWATVADRESGEPVLGARIRAQFEWHSSLPGDDPPAQPAGGLPAAELAASAETAGRYDGQITAPVEEGYYRLVATVDVPGHTTVRLKELILIEGRGAAPPQQAEATFGVGERTGSIAGDPEGPAHPSPRRHIDFAAQEEVSGGGGPAAMPAPGTLGGEQPGADQAPTTAGEAPAAGERHVCAEFEDGMGAKPLPVDEIVTLSFSVSTEPCGATAASVGFEDQSVFAPGEEMVELFVSLSTMDFTVLTPEPQRLFVPRTGKSKNKASFTIRTLRKGVGEITAYLHKNRNFIQGVEIQVNVGGEEGQAIVGTEPLGRPLEGVASLQRRELSLIIRPHDNQFLATMISPAGSSDGILGVTSPQLDQMMKDARQALLDVVYLGKGSDGIRVHPKGSQPPQDVDLSHQYGLDIPEDVHAVALRRLAEAGHLMFLDLFFGPAADANTQAMGETLRALGTEHRLNVQIVSREFLLPWNMLYLADEFNPETDKVDPRLFLGFAHVVEHIPYQAKQRALDNVISSQPRLQVGVHVNPDIDQRGAFSVVADQKQFWTALNGRGGTAVAVRETADEISGALTDASNADQILYFYCHALSEHLDSEKGPGSSFLGLGGGKRLTLKELRQRASERKAMPGSPLVVINACESAELSPLFYGGFMPYFTARGARGMIGTEAEIPALFAARWAERFFQEFLAGNRTLGEVMFDLRWEFYREHRNVLGLIYAMYCDGDTRVAPGLGLTRAAPAP